MDHDEDQPEAGKHGGDVCDFIDARHKHMKTICTVQDNLEDRTNSVATISSETTTGDLKDTGSAAQDSKPASQKLRREVQTSIRNITYPIQAA